MPKASVLPEPVGDLASTSRPASTSGTTSFWTGNGLAMPRASSALVTALDTPRSAKDCEDMSYSLLGGLRPPRGDSGDSTDPDRWSATRQEPREQRRCPL